MIRSRPAPASRATSASSAAKNGLETPFEMDQKVSPEIGCTKAVTYNHLYRCGRGRSAADPWAPTPGAGSASARGGAHRWPRPRSACPGAGLSPQRRPAPAFFERLALLRRGRAGMARARLLHRPADRLQGLPAALGEDRSKPEFPRHPGRHLRARPQPTIRRRLTNTRLELVQQVRPQDRGAGAVAAPQIAQSLRPVGVIAG